MLKSFHWPKLQQKSHERNSMCRPDQTLQSCTPHCLFVQNMTARECQSALLTFWALEEIMQLKHFFLNIVSLPEVIYWQGFLSLQERKWASPEWKHNPLEGEIKADHLRTDFKSIGTVALIKVCFYFVLPMCKVSSMQRSYTLGSSRKWGLTESICT